jgi:hypothetical protein
MWFMPFSRVRLVLSVTHKDYFGCARTATGKRVYSKKIIRRQQVGKQLISVTALFLALTLAHSNEVPAVALPKQGTCPSGAYCAPSSSAKFAVAKVGSCPSGYSTSGNYCLASDRAKHAVPKVVSCPSGYSTNGDYCLGSK